MIKLALPDLGKEELEEIRKVLDSNYLIQGEKVETFEHMVSDYLGVKYCIAVSSGTAALHLALTGLGIKEGDEVIVPDFTFPATANVVELVGAKVRFVDIKLDSYTINEDIIEKSITEKTKAIIPVHEFGQSVDMDKVMELARKFKLKVIEDAACALGAEYKGKKVGTIGDIGCFSFHPRKAITTGEGGMVVTDNDELAQRIKILRNHGISYSNGKIEFVLAGFNYRMTDIQAALGIAQMKKLQDILDYRRIIVKKYEEVLKGEADIILPIEKSYGRHIYQTYHVLLDNRINRDLLKERLKENGIESNLGAYAVHKQWYYKQKYDYNNEIFMNSLIAYKQGLALPLHSRLTLQDVEYISYNIKTLIKEKNKPLHFE